MNRKPIVGILLGDAGGVGSEIIAKLTISKFFDEYCRAILIGDKRIIDRAYDLLGSKSLVKVINNVEDANWDGELYPMLDLHNIDPLEVPFGAMTVISGKSCLDMLTLATDLYKEKKIEGFCFAPLNKGGLKDAGCKFESEHHFLADLFHHTEPFGEINVLGDLWTTRTTSHIPIKEVSQNLSINSIMRALILCNTSLKKSGVKEPRIALCALNPHCGEGGRCGREEIDIIIPAIEQAKKAGICATGPYPSDITFIKAFNGNFDGVVTMYHDQGQIALKLKGFDQGITIAGGLPAPIATCGHGTAYDIAGKGIVKTSAFENAVRMVSKMANHLSLEK